MTKKTVKQKTASPLSIAEELFIHDRVNEALPHFQALAEKGEGRAFYFLGEYHLGGWNNGTVDMAMAMLYFEKGAQMGDPLCQLAFALEAPADAVVQEERICQAIPAVLALAEADDPIACDYVGKAYLALGEWKTAEGWIKKAAKHSFWRALLRQSALVNLESDDLLKLYKKLYRLNGDGAGLFAYNLGVLYQNEWDDETNALSWYHKSVEKGFDMAMIGIADCYEEYASMGGYFDSSCDTLNFIEDAAPEKYEKAMLEWLHKAYDKHGMAAGTAAGRLGDYYKECEEYETAFQWYQKSAAEKDGCGMFSLAQCYYDGEGVEEDQAKALELYQKSYEAYPKLAPDIAGLLTEHYERVGDEANMRLWCQRGAEKGDACCMCQLADSYFEGSMGLEKDIDQAMEWYQKAYYLGDMRIQPEVTCGIGRCYEEKGEYRNARKWYRDSYSYGYAPAANCYALTYLNGHGATKNKKNALRWFQEAYDLSYGEEGSAQGLAAWGISTILKSQGKAEEAEKYKEIALDCGVPAPNFAD